MENKKKIRNNNFYTNKIHNDDEFIKLKKNVFQPILKTDMKMTKKLEKKEKNIVRLK